MQDNFHAHALWIGLRVPLSLKHLRDPILRLTLGDLTSLLRLLNTCCSVQAIPTLISPKVKVIWDK